MKSIIRFFFISILGMVIYAQTDIPVFDKMFGLWEGTYELNGVQYKEKLSTMWVLNHNFFEMVIMGEDINNKESRYEEMLFFGVSKEGNITGWSMDYEGFSNMVNYEGTIYENKVSVTGGNLNKKCTIEFELKDNKIIQRREITKNNEPSIKKEITYTSIRYDYKIHSLPTKYEKISQPGLAYICHLTENFVSVIDSKNNELIGKINCGNGSSFIRFSPDGSTGYISNYNSNTLSIFDKKTNEPITTIDAGEHPTDILPLNKYIFISHQSQDGLWISDKNTNEVIKKMTWGTGPFYYIEKENKIYQVQIFTPFILVIDPNTFEIKKRIKTGGRPMSMAFIQNQRFGYLPNFDLNEVTKLDIKNDAILKHIKNINNPRGAAASPDGKYIYVTNVVDGKVTVIDTESDSIIKVIDGFKMPVDVSFTPDGKFAYVLNQSEATISIINTESYNIEQTINVAYNPITIFIDHGN